ncbi:hypothetical protein [Pantoea agglomerans]|uniref:hypothetical protein n=1 Tax=Enterobacter agglomerans TaxID=549 RepID=UPI00045CCA82|nr:hypothetical protein [Pantoea agglomerans]KDA94727.1 hypothetical protein T296_09270 [Pantoea agglomerans Eh318]
MNIIELRSEKELGYKLTKVEEELDISFADSSAKVTLLTANEITSHTNKEVKYVNATSRFFFEDDGDVILYNVKSASPFYAQIFWDVAHSIAIGSKLYVYEDVMDDCIFEKDYYTHAFQLINDSKQLKIYQKNEELLCESVKGLDSWTFGIPVGPEEPTFLNYTVGRLLELGIADMEIILCGQPHKDFKYFDNVRIVGLDIPAPPVHITRKKNVIAENATKNNLCIFHDRVLLPKNFLSGMKKHGDKYPLTTLQSVYFADKYNLIPRRYSDYGTSSADLSKYISIDDFNKKDLRSLTWDFRFYCQNSRRAKFGYDYPTGSLYICKTALWNKYPQNEKLFWEEYEDIEFGVRLSKKGVPCKINPFTFTQSMNSRSIIQFYGYTSCITSTGKVKPSRAFTDLIPFIKKKPFFRMTEKIAKNKMYSFAVKYSANEEILRSILITELTGYSRLKLISRIIGSISFEVWNAAEFVDDFVAGIILESMPIEMKKELVKYLSSTATPWEKKNALINLPFLHNQLSQSLFHSSFSGAKNNCYIRKGLMWDIGCQVSAMILKNNFSGFYFSMSTSEIKEIIKHTSMMKE